MTNIPENSRQIELDDETLELFEFIEQCEDDDNSISAILDKMPNANYREFLEFMRQTNNSTNSHAKRILNVIKRKEESLKQSAPITRKNITSYSKEYKQSVPTTSEHSLNQKKNLGNIITKTPSHFEIEIFKVKKIRCRHVTSKAIIVILLALLFALLVIKW